MSSRFLATNECGPDRAMRIILGVFLLSLLFWGPKTPWALAGLVPLLTGVVGSCPLYSLLGISTCPMRKAGTCG